MHLTIKILKPLFFITLCLLYACEEAYQPDITTAEAQLVVEGHIEVSDDETPLPPYVILTRSLPFYSKITADQIDALFVHDALVEVSDGNQTVKLEEVCWDDVPDDIKDQVLESLPAFEEPNVNYCIYTDLSFSFVAEAGKSYSLYIETDKEKATATTTIPAEFAPLDSMYFKPAPGTLGDSMLEMHVAFTDPMGVDNFYRYFTSTNGDLFYPAFNSVFSDRLFSGQTVDFSLSKGEPPFRAEDADVYGLFRPGDRVVLRWLLIDEAHYKFWDTLEFNRVNQGPFGSYTQVKSNVEGAIGIWGGYRSGFYERVVE